MSELLEDIEAIPFDVVPPPPNQAAELRRILAKGERLVCHALTIREGGEIDFHAHLNEEHIFFVTEGEAEFEFLNEQSPIRIGPCQGLLIPASCYYRFCSIGNEDLVMTRVGTIRGPDARRIGLDGADIDAQSSYNTLSQGPIAGPNPRKADA